MLKPCWRYKGEIADFVMSYPTGKYVTWVDLNIIIANLRAAIIADLTKHLEEHNANS